MAKKYAIKKGYEHCTVVTSKPLNGNSRFILNTCSQRELKYLYDVIRHEGVILIEDAKEK